MDFVTSKGNKLMKLRSIVACFCFVSQTITGYAQEPETKNVIIITLDGLRWRELFQGADSAVLFNDQYVADHQARKLFWSDSRQERKKTLMPFMWNVIAGEGQLYGNREFKNKVNCTNHHLISYPGYSEMLVGHRDRKVSSNDKVNNPNATVLEFIQGNEKFKNQVAAFATWDAFPYILREEQSAIYVNAGKEPAIGNIGKKERLLNELQLRSDIRSDSLTFQYALEYLKRERPRVTLIGFDETDQHAHAGRYDEYLKAANRIDDMISQLWEWIQSQPDYSKQTTLFITTDHGRGKGPNNWRNHRLFASGSRHIWFAVIGPDTPAFGEMKIKSKTYQNQVARTIAAFLGLPYNPKRPVGEVVQTMLAIPSAVGENTSARNAP
jgi:hypothetical protein